MENGKVATHIYSLYWYFLLQRTLFGCLPALFLARIVLLSICLISCAHTTAVFPRSPTQQQGNTGKRGTRSSVSPLRRSFLLHVLPFMASTHSTHHPDSLSPAHALAHLSHAVKCHRVDSFSGAEAAAELNTSGTTVLWCTHPTQQEISTL